MSLYELTNDEFTSLQQSGVLYKLFPDAPLNLPEFEHNKNLLLVKQLSALLIYNLTNELCVDPEVIVNVLFKYEKELISFLQWQSSDEININEILRDVYEQIEVDE